MKSEVSKLKEELAPVYKDKARLTEELMQCRDSLMRVRDTNALQDKSLNEATGRIRDLKSRNKELSQQVDAERATQAVAATELEVSIHRDQYPSGCAVLLRFRDLSNSVMRPNVLKTPVQLC